MFSVAKFIIVLSTALSAVALTSPHIAHNIHRRAVLFSGPTPADGLVGLSIRRRANTRPSCMKISTSSSMAASSAHSTSMTKAKPAAVPLPSSSKAKTPQMETPTTTKATPSDTPAPQAAPAPTTTSEPSSSNIGSGGPSYLYGTQTGDATYYSTGLGACGIVNHDTDYIAAVSHLLFDTYPGYDGGNPNNNPVCGRKVTASYQGNSVTVTITDRCTGCAITDLDFSPAAYDQLGPVSAGRLHGMTWHWD